MTLIISAYFSDDREIDEADDIAIDEANIVLSSDDWRRHLGLLSLDREDDICVEDLSARIDTLIEGCPFGLVPEPTASDLATARRLRHLVEVARHHECNLIGIAG